MILGVVFRLVSRWSITVVGGLVSADRDQHVTPLLPGRDLRQRRPKDLDVVGGGERPGVPWALHHHQMLPGVEHQAVNGWNPMPPL